MPAVTTSLTASQVPVPVSQIGVLQRNTAVSSPSPGTKYGTFPAFNQNATISSLTFNQMLIDNLNNDLAGGKGSGVLVGLGLGTSSGLTQTITTGIANGQGLVYLAADTTCTLADNQTNQIWLLNSSTLLVLQSLTPPANAACFLGTAITVSGSVTILDNAGVMNVAGAFPIRKTADTGTPGDSPLAATNFITSCLAGDFLWDGAKYTRFAGPILPNKYALVSGDNVHIPSGYQTLMFGRMTFGTGSKLSVSGKLKVIAQ